MDPRTPKQRGFRSVETTYYEQRRALFDTLPRLDRRSFLRVASAAFSSVAASGLVTPHSFQPVSVAHAQSSKLEPFTFAYISDSHLYKKTLSDRFVHALLRAVDDVNSMVPQPDFVLYGGDLAQLGQAEELALGAQILKNIKAPVRMMVGEHDWYLDLGEQWRALFGAPSYSFDHKGVHCVVLNSVVEEDFWTARQLSPMARMLTVAGPDHGTQSPFSVGAAQRAWLEQDLQGKPADTPLLVFSHAPLYKLYKPWNFWTDDAAEVQAILHKFDHVTVFHGHTHQMLTHRIGNIHFQGFLSTAWPWPYAPEGMPTLTVQMGRPDPFDPSDGCGDGSVSVHADGLADVVQNLWSRNPVTILRSHTKNWPASRMVEGSNVG